MSTKTDAKFEAAYDRTALRSAFVSLFWAVISERRKQPDGLKLTELAKQVGSSKHEVSRWFNGSPNWTLNTIARIACALDLDLVVEARDRSTGAVYTPAGLQVSAETTSSQFIEVIQVGKRLTIDDLAALGGRFATTSGSGDALVVPDAYIVTSVSAGTA